MTGSPSPAEDRTSVQGERAAAIGTNPGIVQLGNNATAYQVTIEKGAVVEGGLHFTVADTATVMDQEIREVTRLAAGQLARDWSDRAGLDMWRKGFETSLTPPVGLPFAVQDRLTALRLWMVEVEWPQQFYKSKNAIANFRQVLGDLLDFFISTSTFSAHIEDFYELRDGSRWFVGLDEAERRFAEREYLKNIDLFMNLLFELTAAGNHVCDMVRNEVDPTFRLDRPRLAMTYGPDLDGRFVTVRWGYSAEARDLARPYPGIDALRQELSDDGATTPGSKRVVKALDAD